MTPKAADGDAKDDAKTSVKTAARTLDVFEAFASVGSPMSLTELAERIGAPLSSCHGLVKTLQNRGYLYVLDQRRSFYPSKRMHELSTEIARRDPLLQHLVQTMTALRDATGETVIVGKRQGDEVIYLEVVEGTHLIRYLENPGSKKPLHSSAIGKAILGSLDERALDKLVGQLRLSRKTDATLVDRPVLLDDIRGGRERGYFRTEGENVADVQAIAMVCRLSGETLALAVAGPLERMRRREGVYVEALREHVARIDATQASLV